MIAALSTMRSTRLIFLCVYLHVCGGDENGHEERFISSLPHRMLLRPVRGEVNKKSLRSLEDAIVNTLVLQQLKEGNQDFFGNEVAIQEIVHVEAGSANSTDSGSTRVQFFITGITFLNHTDDQLQTQLGALLGSSFTPEGSLRHFLFLISSDSILGRASTVSVRSLTSNSNVTLDRIESDTPPSTLISTLDIILMCTSGLILLGIVYMVVQHHTDRGYIENERIVLFNRRQNDQSASLDTGNNTAASISDRAVSKVAHRTVGTSNVVVNLEPAGRRATIITNGAKAPEPIAARPSAAATVPEHCLSPYRQFLSEKYRAKWSHPKGRLSRVRRKIAKSATAFIEGESLSDSAEEFVFEDRSDDSIDFFNVDVGSSQGKSKKNAASAVTEWMKTIRVVSTRVDQPVPRSSSISQFGDEDKENAIRTVTVEALSPAAASSPTAGPSSAVSLVSSEASSSGFSTGTSSSSDDSVLAEALSKLSHLSFDQLSLEQSMASSTIASNVREKMEV